MSIDDEYTMKWVAACERKDAEIDRLRTERSGLQSNIDYYREMIDDIRTLTDRAATDRTYDGNLIDDIRAIIGSPVSGRQTNE